MLQKNHDIRLQHYNIRTNIVKASYVSIKQARTSGIHWKKISRIVRGEEDPYDDDHIMG